MLDSNRLWPASRGLLRLQIYGAGRVMGDTFQLLLLCNESFHFRCLYASEAAERHFIALQAPQISNFRHEASPY